MSDFINYLQRRVEETKRDLQAAHEQLQQWMNTKEMLGTELQGYERALAAEMRRSGVSAPIEIARNTPTALTAVVEEELNNGINKAEFARQFIRTHGENGATPNDILEGFQSAGIPIKKPYIYALVQRLQKQGAIKAGSRLRDKGKWFPVEPESLNGAGEKTLP